MLVDLEKYVNNSIYNTMNVDLTKRRQLYVSKSEGISRNCIECSICIHIYIYTYVFIYTYMLLSIGIYTIDIYLFIYIYTTDIYIYIYICWSTASPWDCLECPVVRLKIQV